MWAQVALQGCCVFIPVRVSVCYYGCAPMEANSPFGKRRRRGCKSRQSVTPRHCRLQSRTRPHARCAFIKWLSTSVQVRVGWWCWCWFALNLPWWADWHFASCIFWHHWSWRMWRTSTWTTRWGTPASSHLTRRIYPVCWYATQARLTGFYCFVPEFSLACASH